MANVTPRVPEQFRDDSHNEDDFSVSELVSEAAGAHSPFGNTEFPLPVHTLFYEHPGPADLPNLAEGNVEAAEGH